MKTRIKKLLVCAALVGAATLAHAQSQWYLIHDNGDGTCTITRYIGPGGAVTIPYSLLGPGYYLRVVGIGFQAFSGNSVTSVTIPDNVTSIGYGALDQCSSLTAVTVDAANSVYSSVDGVLFDKNQTTLVEFPGGRGGSYTIPDSVTSIGGYAFADCQGLTSVTIPNSVTSIAGGAFSYCSSLTSVTIGNGVTSIGIYAFEECSSLTSVTIPDSVTSIGGYAFADCQGLTSVTIPNSVTSIAGGAFSYCSSLTSVTIGSGVTSIGIFAFEECSTLRAAYFLGNAPPGDARIFSGNNLAIIYYLPPATGWGPFYSARPTELWNPQASALGVTGGNFGFHITGPSNTVIVVEACTNLAHPVWLPVSTNTLVGSGTSSFSDSQSGNYPARFYRFRSP